MTKQLLDVADVGPAFEQVRDAGVAEQVRPAFVPCVGSLDVLDDLAYAKCRLNMRQNALTLVKAAAPTVRHAPGCVPHRVQLRSCANGRGCDNS